MHHRSGASEFCWLWNDLRNLLSCWNTSRLYRTHIWKEHKSLYASMVLKRGTSDHYFSRATVPPKFRIPKHSLRAEGGEVGHFWYLQTPNHNYPFPSFLPLLMTVWRCRSPINQLSIISSTLVFLYNQVIQSEIFNFLCSFKKTKTKTDFQSKNPNINGCLGFFNIKC